MDLVSKHEETFLETFPVPLGLLREESSRTETTVATTGIPRS